jgi:hypothetical protein
MKPAKPQNRPNQDTETAAATNPTETPPNGHEARGVEPQIADADKVARTGTPNEHVRDTPPFGDHDEMASR